MAVFRPSGVRQLPRGDVGGVSPVPAAGAGEYSLAASATVLTLVVLAVLPPIEGYFERRTGAPNCHVPGLSKPEGRDR